MRVGMRRGAWTAQTESGSDAVFEKQRPTTESQLTVVNGYRTAGGEIYAKKQCMHCAQPACVSACLTGAMHKTKRRSGPLGCKQMHGLPVLHDLLPV